MLVVIYGYKPELDRRFVRLSFVVTRVGGHWELRAEALLKAVWWGYASCKPANALVCLSLFVCLFLRLRISHRQK